MSNDYYVTALLEKGQTVELTQDIRAGYFSRNPHKTLFTDGKVNKRVFSKGTKATIIGHENTESPSRYDLQIGSDKVHSVMEYMVKPC